MPAYQAPPGMPDLLPPASARFRALVQNFAAQVEAAGYGLYVGPLLEDIGVFERVGEGTDIVRNEMYELRDRGDRHLALRPDSTPSVVRAYVQHRPALPLKVWYLAPHFRYDRPQKGRLRQHHSVGIEALGIDDPDLDVEVVGLAWTIVSAIGIRGVDLLLNSMGDPTCKPAYRDRLLAHLAAREGALCDEHRDRYQANPLRVLDCRRAPCTEATADAPRLIEALCGPCAAHFTRVREGLDALEIPYTIAPRLVRGQDYYTRTTFELASSVLASAQNGLGGGGRYDGFAEAIGGPPTPGIGFGLGVERILIARQEERVAEGVEPPVLPALDAFVVDMTGGEHARSLAPVLRAAGLRVDRAFGDRSVKAQMKAADRSGARLAILVGPSEIAAGEVTVRDMRGEGGERRVPRAQLADCIRAWS